MQEKHNDRSERHLSGNLRNNSLIVMAATIASRLLGIVRIGVISRVFGAGDAADIINFTFNIPNNFRKLLAEGALSSAFIPSFAAMLHRDAASGDKRPGHAQRLFAQVLTLQVMLLIPLLLAVFLFPDAIIRFLSDFTGPEMIASGSVLLRLFTIYLVAISCIALFQAVLQCHGQFLLTSTAPLIFSVIVIASILLFSGTLDVYAVGWGVLTGGVVHLLLLLPSLLRRGYRPVLMIPRRSGGTGEFLSGFTPVLSVSIVMIVTQQISFYLATRLTEGAVTALSNSIVFWQMPFGVFFGAVGTVFFPRLSAAYAGNNSEAFTSILRKGSGYIAAFLIPSALLLLFLNEPLVASLLMRGEFSLEDARLTALSLKWFAPSLLFAGLFSYTQRALYAMRRANDALAGIIVYAVLDITVTVVSIYSGAGVRAFGLGSTCGYLAAAAVQGILLLRRLGTPLASVLAWRYLARIAAANVPLGAALAFAAVFIAPWYQSGATGANLLILMIYGIAALALIMGSYILAGVDFMVRKETGSVKNH